VFERFTDRARRVLVLAQEEARLLNHSFIGTEHILLGLIQEGEGVAAQALRALDVSFEEVHLEVEETVGMAAWPPSGSPPFTPRVKKVLELSLREAMQLGHAHIGTEHLLLALVREGDGVAATVLRSLGVELGSVRREVIRLMSGGSDPGESLQQRVLGSRMPGVGSGWAPPAWDRPSEGTIPAVVAVNEIVAQNDLMGVALDYLEVYPNGFTISVVARVNPRKVADMMETLRAVGQHRWPQVGVRFSDGTTARGTAAMGLTPDISKDEEGLPTEPIVRLVGGSSAPGGWRAWAWVYPLPPDGPLEVLVAVEAAGLSEAAVTIDGAVVRSAAGRARVIWR
jgi:hypothetical protein